MGQYIKRFNDQLVGLNTLGALMSEDEKTQLLLNNLWGQMFVHGLSSSFNRVINNAVDKDELEYPNAGIEKLQNQARVWDELNGRRRDSRKTADTSARRVEMDESDDDEPSKDKKETKAAKKAKALKQNLPGMKEAERKRQEAAIDVKVAQIRKDFDKKYKSLTKNTYCFLCGYNKGHHSHLCHRLPSSLHADALTQFNKQQEWLKQYKK